MDGTTQLFVDYMFIMSVAVTGIILFALWQGLELDARDIIEAYLVGGVAAMLTWWWMVGCLL